MPAEPSRESLLPLEPPEAPGAPIPTLIRAHHVMLSWTPSKSSNVNYKIEQRTKIEDEWEASITKKFISSTSTKVLGLNYGDKYFFRVVSYIKKTRGFESPSSDVIETDSPFSKFVFFMLIHKYCSLTLF